MPIDVESRSQAIQAVHCAKCDYDLTGLTVNRCPECGAQFNPQVKFRQVLCAEEKFLHSCVFATCLFPWFAMTLLESSAILATFQIGHWPRPHIDDSNSLGIIAVQAIYFTGTVFLTTWAVLFMAWIPAFFPSRSRSFRVRKLLKLTLLSIGLWGLSILIYRTHSIYLMDWLSD